MSLKKNSLSTNSKLTIAVSLLISLVLIAEFFLCLNQPVINTGFKFQINSNYYTISKVIRDSDSENSIPAGYYKRINGIPAEKVIEYISTHTEQEVKREFSKAFVYGQDIKLDSLSGKRYTLKNLQPLSFSKQFANTPLFVHLKYCIAFLMLISGICITLFLNAGIRIKPLVYSLFFLALTTANLFDSEYSSPLFSQVSMVLMDVGIYLTFTCIFAYFSEIFKAGNYFNPFKYLKFYPMGFAILKYFHMITFQWDLLDNPFTPFTNINVVSFCIIFIFLFFVVIFVFPKMLTVTFKFFLMGITFAVTPLLMDHLFFTLSGAVIMTDKEKIYVLVSFLFIPFMLHLSILQNQNYIRSKIVSKITAYVAFGSLSVPLFWLLLDYIPNLNKEFFALVYILLAPITFAIIYQILQKFFSITNDETDKKLNYFRELISSISDSNVLHTVTSIEIRKQIHPTYIFFYKLINDSRWENIYVWGNTPVTEIEHKLVENSTKKRVTFTSDGGFCVPVIRNNHTVGMIFIGPKENNDQYFPGEHILVEEMIRIFHNHYLMFANNRLVEELKEQSEKVANMQEETILSMANLIESRDGGTGAHVKRTAEYSVLICKAAKAKGLFTDVVNDDYIQLIYKAAPMHDIGKIVVADHILKKPGRFTTEEFDEMKRHTTEGERIVREVLSNSENESYIKLTSDIAMYHHEKWDGSGYPCNLKENQIPLCARILAIADVFDALVSPRCYKEPMEPEEAFNIIRKDAGTHFDPVLAEVFLGLKEQALEIMQHETI